MKRLLILFLLLAVGCNNRQQADNTNQVPENSDSIIYYKSTDGSIIQPNKAALFDAHIVSNTYEDGVGVICFDGPITVIDRQAFYNEDVLSSIIIPNGVTEIGERAFYGCENLTSITIPNSVTEIGSYAFSGCENLTSITIPNSVTEIVHDTFSNCTNLKRFYGKFATSDGKALICNGKLISYAHGNSAESYTIPNSVTEIEHGAFSGCKNLKSIIIPNSVTSIGGEVFYNCENLTSITIPNSVTEIGRWAFKDCKNLTSITIPNSVISIGDTVFSGCENLTSVTIPNSVTSIGYRAFYDCKNLTSITIPDSVTVIGGDAFMSCDNLKEVYCKATTPPDALLDDYYFGDAWCAFEYNASGRKIYVPRESVEAYKTANGWKEYAGAIVGYDF